MEIRPLAETDLPLVSDLSRRVWPLAYAGILTAAQIDNILARIYSVENLKTELAAPPWNTLPIKQPPGFSTSTASSNAASNSARVRI